MKIYKIANDKINLGDMEVKVGDKFLFEYHCWESPDSSDFDLWLHSHQPVKVIGISQKWDGISEKDRYEWGQLNHYKIRFPDGYIHEAGEDELLISSKDFCRPNPPQTLEEYNANPQKWK